MKGVSYLTDSKNTKIAVQIDLKKNNKLWEEFCDFIEGNKRKTESSKSWEMVKRNLAKRTNLNV